MRTPKATLHTASYRWSCCSNSVLVACVGFVARCFGHLLQLVVELYMSRHLSQSENPVRSESAVKKWEPSQ